MCFVSIADVLCVFYIADYPSDNIGCGSWIRAGRYCYNFMRSKSMSWQNARANCQSQNADLIKVDSLDKKV